MWAYPKDAPTVLHEAIQPSVSTYVKKHLSGSRYGKFAVEYLDQCTEVWTLRYPEATLTIVAKHEDVPPRCLLERVLKRVVCLLRSHSVTKHLHFWLLPTPFTRQFPDKAELLGEDHLNGGFTYVHEDSVFVYRREEFPKVMIHETVHHLPYDMGDTWTTQQRMALYKAFRIDKHGCPNACRTDIEPNEAIVEFWANIFQLRFLSYEYGFSFPLMLSAEIRWAATQAKRIMQHQEAFFPEWKETSHAYSYIVFRCILLCNVHIISTWKTPYNPDQVMQLLLKWRTSTTWKQLIKNAKIPRHKSFRMTVFGDL